MLANHSNKKTSELARMILKNIDDSEFFTVYENVETWIKSLDLEEDYKDAIANLKSSKIPLNIFF